MKEKAYLRKEEPVRLDFQIGRYGRSHFQLVKAETEFPKFWIFIEEVSRNPAVFSSAALGRKYSQKSCASR